MGTPCDTHFRREVQDTEGFQRKVIHLIQIRVCVQM